MPVIQSQVRRGLLLRGFAAYLFVFSLLAAASLPGFASEADENANPHVKAGEVIFKRRCLVCHSKKPGDTTPFGPPNLYRAFKGPSALSTKAAANIIAHGKSRMPAWGTVLSKSDINDVITYIRAQ